MTTCNCEPKLKLRCENVSKTFIQKGNQEVPVIRDVTLDVYENEFLVILGTVRQVHAVEDLRRAGNARHRIRDA